MEPKESSGVSGVNLNVPICHLQGNQTNVELEVGRMMPKESSGVSGVNLNPFARKSNERGVGSRTCDTTENFKTPR